MSSSATSGISSSQMASSSVPLRAFEILHVLNDLLTISSGVSSHDCFTQRRTRFFDGAFFFPAGVYSKGPVIIQLRYFRRMLSLNGLLRHLSNGCRTGVRPPGITATSILRRCRSAFTDSVRWAWKESQTSSDRSSQGFHGKQVQK